METTSLYKDVTVIGYSDYARFRINNLVRVPFTYKGIGTSLIGKIIQMKIDGDESRFEVMGLESRKTDVGTVGIGSGFSSLLIDPEGLGFERENRMSHRWYRDGIELHSVSDGDRKLGYEVTDSTSGRRLAGARYNLIPGTNYVDVGLQYVHELQNLYSDLLPDKSLDIDNYIEKRIAHQGKSRKRIDEYKRDESEL